MFEYIRKIAVIILEYQHFYTVAFLLVKFISLFWPKNIKNLAKKFQAYFREKWVKTRKFVSSNQAALRTYSVASLTNKINIHFSYHQQQHRFDDEIIFEKYENFSQLIPIFTFSQQYFHDHLNQTSKKSVAKKIHISQFDLLQS